MHSVQIRNQATKLRKNGKGIYDIAKALKLSPRTISSWCKDIVLREDIRNKIHQNGKLKARKAMLVYTEKLREERLSRIIVNKKEGMKMIAPLSSRDFLMVGLGLYWGEGYKYDNSELGFTNSNLNVIKFYLKWLKLLGVNKENLIFRLTINEVFRSKEKQIKQSWISGLKILENQFTATTFIKTNLKKADVSNLNTYFGILRVKVRKGSELRNKIMGALEHIISCL